MWQQRVMKLQVSANQSLTEINYFINYSLTHSFTIVCDSESHQIHCISKSGKLIRSFGRLDSFMNGPHSVTDVLTHSLTRHLSKGSGRGQFDFPDEIAVDSRNIGLAHTLTHPLIHSLIHSIINYQWYAIPTTVEYQCGRGRESSNINSEWRDRGRGD